MSQAKNHEALTKLLVYLFEAYEKDPSENDSKVFYVYYEAFAEIDVIWLAQRIKNVIKTWTPIYKGHMPPVSIILQPLYEINDLEAEQVWDRFVKYCFKTDCPDDVIALKKRLGASFINRYGLSNENESKWFFKEFKGIYREIKRIDNKLIEGTSTPLLEGEVGDKIKQLAKGMDVTNGFRTNNT